MIESHLITSSNSNSEWLLWTIIRAQRMFSRAFHSTTLRRISRFINHQLYNDQLSSSSSTSWADNVHKHWLYMKSKDFRDAQALIRQVILYVKTRQDFTETHFTQLFNKMVLDHFDTTDEDLIKKSGDDIWQSVQSFGMSGSSDHVKGILRSFVDHDTYDRISSIAIKCVSLLMQESSSSNQESQHVDLNQNINLMKLTASIAILMDLTKKNQNTDAISAPALVRSIRNFESFTFDRLDGEQLNRYLQQMDYISCRVTHAISKSDEQDVIQEDDLNFVSFVERFMIRTTSSLSKDPSPTCFELLQNAHHLIASCQHFINPSKQDSELIYRLNVRLIEHFAQLVRVIDNANHPKPFVILTSALNQVATTLRMTCRPQDYLQIHQNEQGALVDHIQLLKILCRSDLSPVVMLCVHDLLSGLPVDLFLEKRLPRKQITTVQVDNNNEQPIQEEQEEQQDDDVIQYNIIAPLRHLITRIPSRAVDAATKGLRSRDIRFLLDRDDHKDVLCYLLSWSLLCELHSNCRDPLQRASIVDRVKDHLIYAGIFGVSFSYQIQLPNSSDSDSIHTGVMRLVHEHHHHHYHSIDVDRMPAPHKPTDRELDVAMVVTRSYVSHISSRVFIRVAEALPGLVRLWFKHCQDARASSLVEQFVTKQVSKAVIQKEMNAIEQRAKQTKMTNMTIKVSAKRGQVTAVYEQDEVHLDLCVQVPDSYPLKPPTVSSSRRLGLSEAQWRKWVLRMTTVLFQKEEGNTLWDALQTWKSNLDRNFEGAEPCPICYSIVHTHDHSLPKILCRTCKSKYHGGCLYKWFNTSGGNSCPTCRSVSSFVNTNNVAMPSQK
ncbi:hypothetical protein AKO1_015617 [Acrasis kona]|uniref:E3 ubiquitin-protein ligase listerin n=1 Tax=Acrasis kona TaxID=1008807 RepID=A0AAW2ZIJ8_9EUKA